MGASDVSIIPIVVLDASARMLDRLTLGYSWGGKWQAPRVDVAAVFIDQFPDGDLGRQRIARHKLRQFPTVAEALTLGGPKLAVDGVVIGTYTGKGTHRLDEWIDEGSVILGMKQLTLAVLALQQRATLLCAR